MSLSHAGGARRIISCPEGSSGCSAATGGVEGVEGGGGEDETHRPSRSLYTP